MAVANTLAYYDEATIMAVKWFIVQMFWKLSTRVEVTDSNIHPSLLRYGID
jgi:hypothetical protein